MKSSIRDHRYHAYMLSDTVRLEAYRSAFEERITSQSRIAEIGAGTGILSAIASRFQPTSVESVEYFPDLASLAKCFFKENNLDRISIHEGSSFEWSPRGNLDGLFTETIGSWGPEENIVELCRHFRVKNPTCTWMIPSRLTLFAQEIQSPQINHEFSRIDQACATAERISECKMDSIRTAMRHSLLSEIQCSVLHPEDTEILSSPQVVVSYLLGEDSSSQFQAVIPFKNSRSNALHLWFEAHLTEKVILSSHFQQPLTHWKNLYVIRPQDSETLQITYRPKTRKFELIWN